MTDRKVILIGAGIDCGKRRRGCMMGPDAYRTAGLGDMLRDLGHEVEDRGNVIPPAARRLTPPADHVHAFAEVAAWTAALSDAGQDAAAHGMPIFMGGDHAMAAGTVAGMLAHAHREGRPLFVLWLDAHSDFHTPFSTPSGNLHGTPLAYVTGREGFDAFPPLAHPLPDNRLCMIGLRSVDNAEKAALKNRDIQVHDMRTIDEHGLRPPIDAFLERVAAAKGLLHVSLDVDFLDPSIAPAVGTTVPGGATFREAHLIMEMLADSGLVRSLDLAELNPFLDERGRTASLMADLTASLLGKRVFDRETRNFV